MKLEKITIHEIEYLYVSKICVNLIRNSIEI